ncbi:MAG: hypothetical protein HQL37_11160 [Alphaproteobacteria bacterium]|nr:hypothetical protein [Desulfovibrionaceae bacterium]MBF0514420.1 hypothetical protein [Desulfovibrionaceae bacterium]MBF0562557.1 hypothetical protein [Alphaproteobacteria bacterium]
MTVSFPKLLIPIAVAVSCLASCGHAGQADNYDHASQSGGRSLARPSAGNEYAYNEYGDERREERRQERREDAYDEHRGDVAAFCKNDWTNCANNCNNVQDKSQYNLCMVDCNNNLNQCLLQR